MGALGFGLVTVSSDGALLGHSARQAMKATREAIGERAAV
jgi:hypothetical protein